MLMNIQQINQSLILPSLINAYNYINYISVVIIIIEGQVLTEQTF